MTIRPATRADEPAILDLVAARDLADFGEPRFSAQHVIDNLASSEFDPGRDARVEPAGTGCAGWAAVWPFGALVLVHPDREGEGIGTALLAWTQERQRALGSPICRQRIDAGNRRAKAILAQHGYRHARTNWQMEASLDRVPELLVAVSGLTIDPLDPAPDGPALHALDAAAFATDPAFHPESLGDFCREHLEAPTLHAAGCAVARRDGGEVVGFILSQARDDAGYIDLLAVTPGHQGQGIARALLCRAMAALARDGYTRAILEVRSDNAPALALYRSCGLVAGRGAEIWERV